MITQTYPFGSSLDAPGWGFGSEPGTGVYTSAVFPGVTIERSGPSRWAVAGHEFPTLMAAIAHVADTTPRKTFDE